MSHTNHPPDDAGTDESKSRSQYVDFIDPIDATVWHIDVGFTDSNWTCIWNQGCEGILDHRSADLNQGCCSVGAHLLDEDEAMRVGALGVTLDPAKFQNHAEAAAGGVFADPSPTDTHRATRVVNDACIFFNRPGFAGGVGCALHIGAVDEGESPMDWKPSICWQSPLKVDHHDDGSKTLRPWTKRDWGSGGAAMAYCCTDRPADGTGSDSASDSAAGADAGSLPSAFRGSEPVSVSLHAELTGILGPEIAVELRARSKSLAEKALRRERGHT